jgi:hypothetical protein
MTLTMSWAKAQRAIGRPATTAHEAVQNAASFVRCAQGAPPLIDRRALRQTRPENPKMLDEFLEER